MNTEPPLADVVRDIAQKTKTLNTLDDQISLTIAAIERRLRALGLTRVVSVKLPDGADLGWSCRKHSNHWRFVIRTEDDAWDLLSCSRHERVEVFTCGAMERLIKQAGVL